MHGEKLMVKVGVATLEFGVNHSIIQDVNIINKIK